MNKEQTISFLEDEVSRGEDMGRLKNQFLDNFFEQKEQQIFELFKNLPIGAQEDLIGVHHQLKSLNALRVEVQTVMDTAKLAKHQLLDET